MLKRFEIKSTLLLVAVFAAACSSEGLNRTGEEMPKAPIQFGQSFVDYSLQMAPDQPQEPSRSSNAPEGTGGDNTSGGGGGQGEGRSSNMLSVYSSTMGVYGWYTEGEKAETPIFKNQLIENSDTTGNWSYSPVQYWDSETGYRFYAYAPHVSTADKSVEIDLDSTSGYLNIKGINLKGVNLQSPSATPSQIKNFRYSGDIDWMVDRRGKDVEGTTGESVVFTLEHVMAKFNVRVRLYEPVDMSDIFEDVVVDSLSIGEFVSSAEFRQNTYDTPTDAAACLSEWIYGDSPAMTTFEAIPNVYLEDRYLYLIESLVIPQMVNEDMTLRMTYTFIYKDGARETCESVVNLHEIFDDVFDCFISHNTYTLSITIAPQVVTFDAGASKWEEICVNPSDR